MPAHLAGEVAVVAGTCQKGGRQGAAGLFENAHGWVAGPGFVLKSGAPGAGVAEVCVVAGRGRGGCGRGASSGRQRHPVGRFAVVLHPHAAQLAGASRPQHQRRLEYVQPHRHRVAGCRNFVAAQAFLAVQAFVDEVQNWLVRLGFHLKQKRNLLALRGQLAAPGAGGEQGSGCGCGRFGCGGGVAATKGHTQAQRGNCQPVPVSEKAYQG